MRVYQVNHQGKIMEVLEESSLQGIKDVYDGSEGRYSEEAINRVLASSNQSQLFTKNVRLSLEVDRLAEEVEDLTGDLESLQDFKNKYLELSSKHQEEIEELSKELEMAREKISRATELLESLV